MPGTKQPTLVGGSSAVKINSYRYNTLFAESLLFLFFPLVAGIVLLFGWVLAISPEGVAEISSEHYLTLSIGALSFTILGFGLGGIHLFLAIRKGGEIEKILEDEKKARELLITQTMVDERLAWLASCFHSAGDHQRKLHQERATKDYTERREENIQNAEDLVSETKAAFWKERDRYARLGYEVRDSHMDYPLEDAEPEPA